jgi:tetratricopeptide (TPR) repeat protein
MTRRWTRKELKRDELREVAGEFEHWFEARWRSLAAAGGAVFLVALAGLGWVLWRERRIEAAARYLNEGLHLAYPALGGTAGAAAAAPADDPRAVAAFEKAEALGGKRGPGLAARYSKGAALLRMSRAGEAAEILEEVARADSAPVLKGAAKALAARAYLAAGNPEKAGELWRELADGKSGIFPADVALLELGQALRSAGKDEEARKAWQELLARYPQSGAAEEARRALGGRGPEAASQ